jgi:hypothetical protein
MPPRDVEGERLLRRLEADPSVEAEAAALDPALLARLTSGVRRRTSRAARFAPALQAGGLAACAAFGVWLGWIAQPAASPPTLLASVQISPIGNPP